MNNKDAESLIAEALALHPKAGMRVWRGGWGYRGTCATCHMECPCPTRSILETATRSLSVVRAETLEEAATDLEAASNEYDIYRAHVTWLRSRAAAIPQDQSGEGPGSV